MPRRVRPTIRQIKVPIKIGSFVSSVGLAAVIGWLAHFGLDRSWTVLIAAGVVVVVELGPRIKRWREDWLTLVPPLLLGIATAVIIALSSRALTQVGVGIGYAIWRSIRLARGHKAVTLSESLGLQAVVLEAIFLASAIWRTPAWICLVVAWATSYLLVYEALLARGERLARVLAATWSLIVVEVGWVLLNWLVTYVLFGSYILVPQAALILTGLAYCFGGIYISQRQQALTRGRLAEYLLIALLLTVIVVSSTPWRGTL